MNLRWIRPNRLLAGVTSAVYTSSSVAYRRKLGSPRGRLRGDDGRLLSCKEELQHITAYGNKTFAAKPDDHPIDPLLQPVHIADEELQAELDQARSGQGRARTHRSHSSVATCSGRGKPSPGPSTPSSLAARARGPTRRGLEKLLHGLDSQTQQTCRDVASLRPIGLSSPASKALAGSLRHHLLRGLEPTMQFLPQFAYAKNRGTADALLQAHSHFEAVTQLIVDTQCTRFQKQARSKQSPMYRRAQPVLGSFQGL